MPNVTKDLVAASATPLVLGILAENESYGYAILKRVSNLSNGQLQWTDGMLYPLLHRLERLGHVKAGWGRSETGRNLLISGRLQRSLGARGSVAFSKHAPPAARTGRVAYLCRRFPPQREAEGKGDLQ